MDLRKMINKAYCRTGLSGFFSAYGSFGVIDGRLNEVEKTVQTENGFEAVYNGFKIMGKYKKFENDVWQRYDFFENISDEKIIINQYTSRFLIEGGEYEVYTQYSSWQHESLGGWQDLVTGIEVYNAGLRTTDGGAPIIALRNKGNERIFVFHLIPNAQWIIKVTKLPIAGKADAVLIEMGINNRGLNLVCNPGERIEMPQIFAYEAKSIIDLDAWKMHIIYNKLYPRRELPVIYNTWLLDFDNINIDEIYRQIDCASELGIEVFAIDAGWFGLNGMWDKNIGNWVENKFGGFYGRLSEVSDYVRSKGLRFGLWLEGERALENAENVKKHPEQYIKGNNGSEFLDYSKAEARQYIFETICTLVDKYNIEYMKFDFNDELCYDVSGNGFYRYFQGYKEVISQVRARYPHIYITNCAGGGTRMDMGQNIVFDSVWISDNHSPIDALRIFKDTAKRLPPCNMEKWDARIYCHGFPEYGSEDHISMPISCDGSDWSRVICVNESFTHTYLTGGVMGFSSNIADFPEYEKINLKEIIRKYKNDRNFYKNAVMRILYDIADVLVLQYSDSECKNNIIQVFCKNLSITEVTFYPELIKDRIYICNDTEYNSNDLISNGMTVELKADSAFLYELKII